MATVACGLSLVFSGCALTKKPMYETVVTSAASATKPVMPAIVMRDASDIRKFLNKIKGDARFKDMELVRVLDTTGELDTIKEKFAGIPNTGALFYPAPIVASMKGGGHCPFLGEGILVSVGGGYVGGWQARNSNLCVICYQHERKQFILHEMIHYLHWRASGGRMSFNKNGHPVETAMPPWILEGFPALIYRGSLREYTKEQYDDYTNLLKLLEEIARNKRIAREAFLFGDLRKLQQIVDGTLGERTFERALAKASSSSHDGITDALNFLYMSQLEAMQKELKLLEEKSNKEAESK